MWLNIPYKYMHLYCRRRMFSLAKAQMKSLKAHRKTLAFHLTYLVAKILKFLTLKKFTLSMLNKLFKVNFIKFIKLFALIFM